MKSEISSVTTLNSFAKAIQKRFSLLFLYLSGIDENLAEDLSPHELMPYKFVGMINFSVALLIFPFIYTAIQDVTNFARYSTYPKPVNYYIFLPVSLVAFGLYCFLRRYISLLHIRNVLNWKYMLPFLTCIIVLSLITIGAFSFAFSSSIIESQTQAIDRQIANFSKQINKLDSIYDAKHNLPSRRYNLNYLSDKAGLLKKSKYERPDSIKYDRLASTNKYARLDSIKHARLDSINYENQRMPLQEKVNTLTKEENEIDNTTLFFIIGGILVVIYATVPIIIFTKRNDLYHEILKQKEIAESKLMDERKNEILSRLERKTEIGQTLQALNELNVNNPNSIQESGKNYFDINNPINLESFADYQMNTGNYQNALNIYNDALRLAPEKPELWKKKADVLKLLNQDVESFAALNRYTSILRSLNFKENLNYPAFIKSIHTHDITFYGNFNWTLTSNINVLLGKNGYGKSHLLSIIAALLQEDEENLSELGLVNKSSDISRGGFIVSESSNKFRTKEKPNISIPNISILLNSSKNDKSILELTAAVSKKQKELDHLISRRDREHNIKSIDDKSSPPDKDKLRLLDEDINKLGTEIKGIFDQIELLRGKIKYSAIGFEERFGKISVLAIPDIRFINKSSQSTPSVPNDDNAKNLVEYGAYYFIKQLPYENTIQNFLNTICNIYLDKKSTDEEIFRLINRVFKRLTGNEFIWSDIRRTPDNSAFVIMVKTDGNDQSLPIQKVSQGTISVLSIFGLIYNYLSLRYPDLPGSEALKKHSIIFIDEIDAHLHPSWQQKIISLLRDEFPNVQFIISAHSPLIVAGCKEGEVSVLRRNLNSQTDRNAKNDSGFAIESIERNLIGMPIADIFQLIFEIEEKDEMFLEVMALLPFQDMMSKRHLELSRKPKLTSQENEELLQLSSHINKLTYVDQVQTLRSSKDTLNDLQSKYESKLTENIILKKENEELKNNQ